MEVAGPLGTPLGLAQRKRASPRGEAGMKVPRSVRKSNQSIPKEISPECSLEGPMLKLKLQYLGHLMQRTDSFKKTLMLGNQRIDLSN